MLTKRIALLKAQMVSLKLKAEETHSLMTTASFNCPIAAETYYLRLLQLDDQYLDLDAKVQELLKVPEIPTVSTIVEDQAVS